NTHFRHAPPWLVCARQKFSKEESNEVRIEKTLCPLWIGSRLEFSRNRRSADAGGVRRRANGQVFTEGYRPDSCTNSLLHSDCSSTKRGHPRFCDRRQGFLDHQRNPQPLLCPSSAVGNKNRPALNHLLWSCLFILVDRSWEWSKRRARFESVY